MRVLMLSPHDLRPREPFRDLFPVQPHVQAAIKEVMQADGVFDASKPIDVWEEADNEYTIIDGHTRWLAALEAGVLVWVALHDFPDERVALEYAIANQRNRRNMTDADILRCVQVLDKRKREGRPSEPQKTTPHGVVNNGSSSRHTAELLGVSERQVERTRTILDHAPEPIKAEVRSGQLSINAAYNQTQEQRRVETPRQASFPTFNRTNDNIEWALWTWNPVTGCKHDCPYCYARDIANRFYPQGFEPTFHPERLTAPQHTRVPDAARDNPGERNVFVCSMADLFGKWVPQEWIDAVLAEVRKAPQWTFIFLTKNPRRLVDIAWPENAWVGTTVDKQARVKPAEDAFAAITARVRFLSCEPLRERLTFNHLDLFDWLIVGGQSRSSGEPEAQPQPEWLEHLQYQWWQAGRGWDTFYWKPNLTTRPRGYPH